MGMGQGTWVQTKGSRKRMQLSHSMPRRQWGIAKIKMPRNIREDKFILKVYNRRKSPKFQKSCFWGEKFRNRIFQVVVFNTSFCLIFCYEDGSPA